jgi:hypothetical protein
MRSIQEIEDAIEEAERVQARRDGVHAVHNCVVSLRLCREVMERGEWTARFDHAFAQTVVNLRHIDRTGFASGSRRDGFGR